MHRRMMLLAFTAALVSACASGPPAEVDWTEFDLPVYYTESGVGREFEEIGRVRGSYSGECGNDDYLVNRAKEDAVAQARSMGADAVLIPDSFSMSGEDPAIGRNCSRPFSRLATVCLCGAPLLFPPKGHAEINGLAIRFVD